MKYDDESLIYAEAVEIDDKETTADDVFEIMDDTTVEGDDDKLLDTVEEERRAFDLFKKTGIVQAKKGGTGKSYLEEMDEGNEVGYEAEKRKDGLRYFHRVGHTTAATTDKPLIIPPTEQDVEDLMLLDALRRSMGITDELEATQFRNIKLKLQWMRRAGLDENTIFNNPSEFSTLDEYYAFLNAQPEEEEYEEEYEIDDDEEEEHFLSDDDDDEEEEVFIEEEGVEHRFLAGEHNLTVYDSVRPEMDDDYEIIETTENLVHPTVAAEEYFEDADGNLRLRRKPVKKHVVPVPAPQVRPPPVAPKLISKSTTIAELINRLVGIPAAATSEAILPDWCNNCYMGLACCCGVCPAANPNLYPRSHRNRRVEVMPGGLAADCGTSSSSSSGSKSESSPTISVGIELSPAAGRLRRSSSSSGSVSLTRVYNIDTNTAAGVKNEFTTPSKRIKPARRVARKTWIDT